MRVLALASILLLVSAVNSTGVYPVFECYESDDQTYCETYWGYLNCNPSSVSTTYTLYDANDAVMQTGTLSVPSGYVVGNGAGQGYCSPVYSPYSPKPPTPWTLSLTANGETHNATWSGSTSPADSPAGNDCFVRQHFIPAPPCPPTPAPTTTPPPTTLPVCGSCPCQCP